MSRRKQSRTYSDVLLHLSQNIGDGPGSSAHAVFVISAELDGATFFLLFGLRVLPYRVREEVVRHVSGPLNLIWHRQGLRIDRHGRCRVERRVVAPHSRGRCRVARSTADEALQQSRNILSQS